MALLALFSPLPFIQINPSGVRRDLCSSRRQEDPSKSLFPCSLLFLLSGLKGPLNYTAVVVKFMTTWSETWFHLESLGVCERFTSGGKDFRQDSIIGESIQKSFCLQALIPAACFSNVQFSLSDFKYTEINLMNWICKNPSQKRKMGLWLKDITTDQC